jgi:hypothetical protein
MKETMRAPGSLGRAAESDACVRGQVGARLAFRQEPFYFSQQFRSER